MIAREVSGDKAAGFIESCVGIHEDQNRRAGTAEGRAENSIVSFQFLQTGQQRAKRSAIGLVDAVFERCGKKIGSALREGGQHQHGILYIDDGVGPRILRGEHEPSFFRRKAFLGNGQQERPLPFWADAGHLRFGGGVACRGHARDGEAAHPAGGGVVGVVLAAGGFADDLRVSPAEVSKLNGQGDSRQMGGGGRAAAFADGDIVVDVKGERVNFAAGGLEDFAVGVQDEVVFDSTCEFAADFAIASGGGDGEFFGGAGVELDVEIHRERGGVEGRTEIGGRRGKSQAKAGASLRF